MAKITKARVEIIKPDDSDIVKWDDELRGFGVRVKPSGVRSYIIQYRNLHGRSRRYTIGTHGRMTTEKARKEAKILLGDIERGADPAEDKARAHRAERFLDFAKRYMTDYAPTRKRPSSIETDRINLELHVLPALGNIKVAAITRADVVRLYQSMKDIPGAANRTLALVSHMLNVAEKWGLRPDGSNPCRHVDKYKEQKRERYLTADELARLGDTLSKVERQGTETSSVVAAIRLLILTGCRRSEILTLRWEHVDFDGECLRLPESKTGAKVVHLPAPALEVLNNLNPQPEGWVITGAKEGMHLVNLRKPWLRIRNAAGIEDVRIHDLRHSFASIAVGLGEGLPIIGKMLGHTQAQTTQRYAHLAADPVKKATERVSEHITAVMKGNKGDVLTLRQPRP